MNCFLSLLCYFVMCYFMGIVIFSTRFHLLVEYWVIPHCGYVLYPIGGFYPIAVMCYVPLLLYSHCGFIPSGVCVNFSVYGSFPMWYCVCKCINTKNLPTDFHWSMGRLLHTIVMYGVMVVCIVGIVFYLLAYVIIIQSGGGKSNKKNVF